MRKVSKYGAFSGLYFPVFGLNTEICRVNLCVQSKCGKIRNRNNTFLVEIIIFDEVKYLDYETKKT